MKSSELEPVTKKEIQAMITYLTKVKQDRLRNKDLKGYDKIATAISYLYNITQGETE